MPSFRQIRCDGSTIVYYGNTLYIIFLRTSGMAHTDFWRSSALVYHSYFFLLHGILGAVQLCTNRSEGRYREERIDCRRHKHNITDSSIFVCHHTSICYCRKVGLSTLQEPSGSLFINLWRSCRENILSTGCRTHEQKWNEFIGLWSCGTCNSISQSIF